MGEMREIQKVQETWEEIKGERGGHRMGKFREDVGSERIAGWGNIVDGEIAR